MELKGKCAAITGGNSGIGLAIAEALARQGVNLALCGRREAQTRQQAERLMERYCTDVLAVRADVSREGDCIRFMDTTREHFGRLDILVNNAGIYGGSEVAEMDSEAFERVMNTNLYGALWCARRAMQLMAENELHAGLRGYILNISSICGKESWAGHAAYSASKHAMMALNAALADEGKVPRIKSTAICPAMVVTPMTGVTGEDYLKPEDIAEVVSMLFRLSPACWPTEIVLPRRDG